MPVWYTKNPLGALIFCGLEGSKDGAEGSPHGHQGVPHGLKLAVMARPCFLRQPRVKLSPLAVKVMRTLNTGSRTVAELADCLVECEGKRRKARDNIGSACNVLLSFLLVGRRGSVWRLTPAGQAWLCEMDKAPCGAE